MCWLHYNWWCNKRAGHLFWKSAADVCVVESERLPAGEGWCVSVLMNYLKCAVSLSRSRGVALSPGAAAEQRSSDGRVSGPECHCPRASGTTGYAPPLRENLPLSPGMCSRFPPWVTYTPARACPRLHAGCWGGGGRQVPHTATRLQASGPREEQRGRGTRVGPVGGGGCVRWRTEGAAEFIPPLHTHTHTLELLPVTTHDVHNHQRSQQTCYTAEDRWVCVRACVCVSAWCNVTSAS